MHPNYLIMYTVVKNRLKIKSNDE